MNLIGKLDRSIYKCISSDMTTDEVIITDERIAHIKEGHPTDYDLIAPFMQDALEEPDFIIRDKRKNTGLILKHIETENFQFQMVLKIHTSSDPEGFKNSIISAWRIREDEWNRVVKNKTILYKKE